MTVDGREATEDNLRCESGCYIGETADHGAALVSATTVSVIIPNSSGGGHLREILGRIPEEVHEVIVVNSPAVDDRLAVPSLTRPEVITLQQTGTGKGNALACGFWASSGEIIVTLEPDGSTDPAEIPRFVAALLAGADFAKGSRFVTGGGTSGVHPMSRIGHWAVSTVVSRLWHLQYSDVCYGYNAFWHHCLPFLFPDCRGIEVGALLSIRAARAGLRVHEVASMENTKHVSNPSDACKQKSRVLRTIAAECIRPV